MHWFSTGHTDKPYPWLETTRGRALAAAEGDQLRAIMPYLIGYRLLQIGPWAYSAAELDSNRMLSSWVAATAGEPGADLWFDGQHLPITSRCMDAMVLPHALEHCPSPRRLLREVDRVLCDRGQLVLLGFNPLNPKAVARRAVVAGAGNPSERHLYTMGRVGDWLDLLDFEIIHARRFGVGFPYLPAAGVDVQASGRWRLPATLSQAYVLVARKRIVTAIPMRRPRKARSRRMATAGIPVATPRINSYSEAA